MNVKLKALLISFFSFVFIIVFTLVIFNLIIFKYIHANETKDLNTSFEAVNSIINREEVNMGKISLDWSQFDDTYGFLSGENYNSYIEKNLQPSTLNQLNLNFMFFTNSQGNMYYSLSKDIKNQEKNILTKVILSDTQGLFKFRNNDDVHSGILCVSGKMYIVTASPITTSTGTSTIIGTLVIGRSMDDSLFNYIDSITRDKVTFKEVTDSNNKADNVVKKDNNIVTAYKKIEDINGKFSIVSLITMQRDEYKLGVFYFKVFVSIFSVLLLITIFVAAFFFDKCILKRLRTVNEFIHKVSKTKDTKARLDICGGDEINNIADSINNMLYELDAAYNDILNLSFCDKLTGLKNRAYIENKFDEMDKQTNINYYIIFGDVNGLKLVNDTFGHREGDRLICMISNILGNVCSKEDIVARWSGDEFTIVVFNKDHLYLTNLLQNISKECEKVTEFSFEISIALGSAENSEKYDSESVMSLAEERMYRGKLIDKKSSRNSTLLSLEKTLYEKHSETEEHTQRVKGLSLKLGEKLNFSQDKLNELELVSILHDIGKIGIPEQILMKLGKLTSEEWEIMKRHTEIGYRIAKATSELSHVANEILCHHEKFDGTGYPQGLKGEKIPVLSRIVNIADSFDVMTHKRVYKEASSIEQAIEELKRCSGTQFDPVILNEFLKLLEEEKQQFQP